ncbi:MAG: serine/threonine-protein kinase [Planctomycetota bacterium]
MPKPPPTRRVPQAGERIDGGRYQLVRKLGAGGNGVVWLANHTAMSSQVVIKFPNAIVLKEESGREQFEQEVRSLVAYSNRHPHIVNVLDVGNHQGRPFVVMQHLTNGSLAAFVYGTPGFITPGAARLHSTGRWVVAIAEALDCLHSSGLVHRDVKPGNILLDESFSAYLADFGIATMATTRLAILDQLLNAFVDNTQVVGSLPYIAPEVLLGEKPTAASDQYSLAVTVYEYLSGRQPYEAASAKELAELHAKQGWTPLLTRRPDIAPAVWDVLARGLGADPRGRFESCGHFATEVAARWPSPPRDASMPPRTKRPLPSSDTKQATKETSVVDQTQAETKARDQRKTLKLSRLMRDQNGGPNRDS